METSTQKNKSHENAKRELPEYRDEGAARSTVNQITLNLLGGVVLISIAVTFVLLWMAESQNTQAGEATHTMVLGGLAALNEQVKSQANDYGWWDDHYQAYISDDAAWMDENVGASVYDTQVSDLVTVISPDGKVDYSWIGEKYKVPTEIIFTPDVVERILDIANTIPLESLAARSVYISANGGIIVVGISHIAPILDLEEAQASELPIFVMGFFFSPELLKDLGQSFLIDDLRLVLTPEANNEEYISFPAIRDLHGKVIGRLVWTPPTPGYEVLQGVIVPMGIVLGLFSIVGLATVLRARHLAVALAETNEDLKTSEQELAEQLVTVAGEKENIESIVASMGEGLIAIDPTGKVFLCNSVGAILLGKKRNQIIGSSLEKVLDIDRNKSLELASVFGILHTRKTVEVPEVTFTRADGNQTILSLTATPVELKGSFIGGIIVFNDVTEQKMVENAKRQFITTAAHQLRTPLSGVKWAMSVLVEGKKVSPKERTSLITKSFEGINRVISLVNDLLNVDKVESGEIEFTLTSTNIVELVRDPLTDLKAQMENKKLKVDFKPQENLPNVLVDQTNMRIVFQNLLENSFHYTPAKGSVKVTVDRVGDEVRVSVTDTGIGIPRGEQKSIFLRFFRASNAIALQPNGSGLGLYICKQIVEQHRGKIWFESEENKGATFHVILPVEKSAPPKEKKRRKKA